MTQVIESLAKNDPSNRVAAALLVHSPQPTNLAMQPSRVTPKLLAQHCLTPAETHGASHEDIATKIYYLNRLRLNDLNLTSMQGIDLAHQATHLYLQRNLITKIEDLDLLTNLKFLTLAHNQLQTLDGQPPPLANLTSLMYLDISHNRIRELKRTHLPTSLLHLDAKGNPCTSSVDYASAIIEQFPHLVTLDGGNIYSDESGESEGESQASDIDEKEEAIDKSEEGVDGEGAKWMDRLFGVNDTPELNAAHGRIADNEPVLPEHAAQLYSCTLRARGVDTLACVRKGIIGRASRRREQFLSPD